MPDDGSGQNIVFSNLECSHSLADTTPSTPARFPLQSPPVHLLPKHRTRCAAELYPILPVRAVPYLANDETRLGATRPSAAPSGPNLRVAGTCGVFQPVQLRLYFQPPCCAVLQRFPRVPLRNGRAVLCLVRPCHAFLLTISLTTASIGANTLLLHALPVRSPLS
jgi:hypothetical protein